MKARKGDDTHDEGIIADEDPTYVVDNPEDLVEVVPDQPAAPSKALRKVTTIHPDQPRHPNVIRRSRSTRVAEPLPPPISAEPPLGMATEAQLDGFRELRTRLLAMAAGLELTQFTTLVVPMTRGSGGSFIARNLAAAFTLQDRRAAMLVDCNTQHPTQHIALRTPTDAGLFDFLEEPYAQVDSLVQPTGIPGLHVIPAGRARSRFREYFSSPAMKSLITAIRQGEYYIFLDGPAARGSPDARILSDLADFIVMVVGYGKGTAEEIAQAAAMFDPAKFAGVVFNERG